MKTKKCGVYAALAAVLLVMAMLVTTCTGPLNPDGLTVPQKEGKDFVPPPGKAYLRVNIPQTQAGRTIMPDDPGTVYYKVEIVGQGAFSADYFSNTDADGDGDFADGYEVFTVSNSGIYQVSIFAYAASDFTGDPVAAGQENVTVSAEGNGSVTITVKEIVDDSTTGTFSYDVTLPSTFPPETATISVTKYTGGAPVLLTDDNLLSTSSASETIPSGYYWVRVTMEKGTRYDIKTISHILHVYGGQISVWGTAGEPIELPELTKKTFDVTYNENYGDSPTTVVDSNGTGDPGWPHGSLITIHEDYDTDASGVDPYRSGFTFDGWFTTNHSPPTAGDQWVFATNRIYKDTTLFAGWTLDVAGLIVSIDPYAHPTDLAPSTFSGTASYTQAQAMTPAGPGGTGNIHITVSNAGTIFDANSYGWYYNDPTLGNDRLVSQANANELIKSEIDTRTSIDFKYIGTYEFIFKATKSGIPYTGTFTITITP